MELLTYSPSSTYQEALDRAAAAWEIDLEYWDVWGRRHITSKETKQAILGAFGVEVETTEQLDGAVKQRLLREWSRLVPPCLVISEHQHPMTLPVFLPAAESRSRLSIELEREDGLIDQYAVDLARAHKDGEAEINGERFVRKLVALPDSIPLGYHDLKASLSGGSSASMRLIVTPDRAYRPDSLRAAGIAITLYGLRSERNWGCGDFGDLGGIADWVADDVGAGFIGLNPLHAIHNRRPYNTSPYLPNCVYYQNPLYLDVEEIPDFQASVRAQRLWAKPEIQAKLKTLRESEFVEYEQVYSLKLRFLKHAFVSFLHKEVRRGTRRAVLFRDYLEQEGELLERFATYCALDEYIHERNPEIWIWPDWPEPYRHPDSPETKAFRKKHWRRVLFYQYLQWQVDEQLAGAQAYARQKGLSIGLYHDLALATDRCGSDLWAYREYFVSGCRVGAPPDVFAPKGQDWAFPPADFERHRESGYELFAESIRKNCRHGGALRIDHVMRFFRLFWIPDGMEAADGTYVRDRYEDLLRILALESVRNKVVVVGEDLGTVEPSVRKALEQFGVLSYRLLYFEKDEHGRFRSCRDYPEHALVSVTTHDLPTLAGFWVSEDIEARRKAGTLGDESAYRQWLEARAQEKQHLLDRLFELNLIPGNYPRVASLIPELTGELHNAIVGFLASTPSQLLVINQEDLTKEVAQQNLPSTTWQYPNWSRKMGFTVTQLREDQRARDCTRMLRNWLRRTGRLSIS